jgi:hypothetical protein
MHRILATLVIAALALLGSAGLAFADDWTVTKARGAVQQLVEGAWQPLLRGDVVRDARLLRTQDGARAELVRGTETIEIGPATQIRIEDRGGQRPFTTVQEYFGDVAVDADVRNVRHFAVQTPFVAAVVKGTHFEVVSGPASSTVSVQRGKVWVGETASNRAVIVVAGQSVTAGRGQPLGIGSGVSVVRNGAVPVAAGPIAAPVAPGDQTATPPAPTGVDIGIGGTGIGIADTGGGLDVDVTLGGTDVVDLGVGGGDGIDLGIADGGGGGVGVSVGGGDGLDIHIGHLHIGL